MASTSDLAWKLMVQLRKEVLASQKIRVQVMGFKITLVTSALALIISSIRSIPPLTLAIPAITAIFFDYAICSYSFSIKRIGFYCRKHLEPKLRSSTQWPDPEVSPLWEEFLCLDYTKQKYSIFGNLGLTGITIVLAFYPIIAYVLTFDATFLILSTTLFVFILILFVDDIKTHYRVKDVFSNSDSAENETIPKSNEQKKHQTRY